ncbi:MAG: NADP-dependent phosphogluconate dehydrogenase [Candidatus Saccharimonadales bacterium]
MKIIIHGLGRMGMQIAHKLVDSGHEVIAHNRSSDKVDDAAAFGAKPAPTKADAISLFGNSMVVVWVMLPADVVDEQIDDWMSILPAQSIIVDGGNSDFRLTKKLNERVQSHGFRLVDVGVSGGVWGYKNGFSMMAGSDDPEAFSAVEEALKTLAAPEGAYAYFGPSGSGHFVKMVHNAIEYGMMESLAEGYNVLKTGPYKDLDLAAAGDVWQHHSVVTSWLNELCRDSLKQNPELNGIDGYVAENGETRWTLEAAKDHAIPTPAIAAAMEVRLASQRGETNFATKLLAAMRNQFGGHALNKDN